MFNHDLTGSQKEALLWEFLKGLNQVSKEVGWNITKVLEFLIQKKEITISEEKSQMNFKEVNGTQSLMRQNIELMQKEIWSLQTVLKLSKVKQLRKGLRIYSKGLGVICSAQKGIKQNQLIGQYFGEVYPQWYWDLKQSVLNTFISDIKTGKRPEFQQYQ